MRGLVLMFLCLYFSLVLLPHGVVIVSCCCLKSEQMRKSGSDSMVGLWWGRRET